MFSQYGGRRAFTDFLISRDIRPFVEFLDDEDMLGGEAKVWEADEAKPFPEAEESKPSVVVEAEAAPKGDETNRCVGGSSLRMEASAYRAVGEEFIDVARN